MRYLLSLLLFSSILTALFLSGCGNGDAAVEPYFHSVIALQPELQDSYQVERRFVGQVEARQRAEVGFEFAGSIAEILVDEGELVSKGQPLARLDTELLKAEKEGLVAQSEELDARQKLVAIELKRQRGLKAKGFAAEQRVDELLAEQDALSAQSKRIEALLSAAQTRIAKSTLRAPYDALVSDRYFDAGSVVAGGVKVLRLLESAVAEARVGVPLESIQFLSEGGQVWVSTDADKSAAKVISVGKHIHAATHTVPVRLALPADKNWSDGDVLYLVMEEARDTAGYWLPLDALQGGVRGLWEVYALQDVDDESVLKRIERRDVELHYSIGDKVYVSGGITEGEQLVKTGLHRLVPGQRVRVQGSSQ